MQHHPDSSVTRDESSQLSGLVPSFGGVQACAGADQRLFFPRKGNNARLAVAAAKRYCVSCPVLMPCRDYALSQGRRIVGVWGGLTEDERRAIARGRRLVSA